MSKPYFLRPILWLAFFFMMLLPGWAGCEEAAQPVIQITFKRAAVASFLVGRRPPQLDAGPDQTLNCPMAQICFDDPSILPNAGPTLTRLVDKQLRGRFGQQVVPRSEVKRIEDSIKLDMEVDTIRSMAEQLGKALKADVVMVGMVWRYRDRGTVDGVPDRPASVAFAVMMLDSASGRVLWRRQFDETQQTLFENVLDFKKNLKLGLKWLTANELAEYGVSQVFSDFLANTQPGDFEGGKP